MKRNETTIAVPKVSMSLLLDPRFHLRPAASGFRVVCLASELTLPVAATPETSAGSGSGIPADTPAKSKSQLKKEAKGIVKVKKEKVWCERFRSCRNSDWGMLNVGAPIAFCGGESFLT